MVDPYQAPPRAHTNGQHSPKRFAFTRSIQRVFMNKTRSRRLPVDIYLYKPSEGRPYTYVQYKAWGSRKVGVEPVRTLERKISLPSIQKKFNNVEEFISVAATVMNRRKSRAGHSLEHHVEELLRTEKLPFDRQARIDGKVKPDLLIPGKSAYDNPSFPASGLIVAGLKTTCKDRWRQILNEGKRVKEKHLLTLQEAISADQLAEMHEANVTLVVPKPFHKGYDISTGIRLLTIEGFITKVRTLTKDQAACFSSW